MASATPAIRVETGVQLLARLTRKPTVQNFYPVLFESGPKAGEVIELLSDDEVTCLLVDITCSALLHKCVKGVEAGVLLFNCSGRFNANILLTCLRNKIKSNFIALKGSNNSAGYEVNDKIIDELLERILNNFFLVEIYDSNQFYATIHKLENILMEHSNISLVIFDSITEFYWSEQNFRIMKMDTYLKKILNKIQKITKEQKVTIMYTRPEHFCSSKDSTESLELCSENPVLERINYRIHLSYINEGVYKVNLISYKKQKMMKFSLLQDQFCWE